MFTGIYCLFWIKTQQHISYRSVSPSTPRYLLTHCLLLPKNVECMQYHVQVSKQMRLLIIYNLSFSTFQLLSLFQGISLVKILETGLMTKTFEKDKTNLLTNLELLKKF